ncbi:MAG: hypothetical protein SFX72_07765 [Isosphaeraceae bacterium]|nr:hypothetical protein [Isosphaeraceae bacterium]
MLQGYRHVRILGAAALFLSIAIEARAAGVSVRWMGQDGKDLVGQRSEPGPSDVLDVRIAVDGLPRSAILSAEIQGKGGGAWHSGKPPVWLLKVERVGLGPRADLYFEPYQVESGREFVLVLQLENRPAATFYFKGGKADPNKRVASAKLTPKWVGMTDRDLAGLGPNPGPDGLLDAGFDLIGLSAKDPVREIRILPAGSRTKSDGWCFGVNHDLAHNAEFVADPKVPGRGRVSLQPDGDLSGKTLAIQVTYASGNVDRASLVAGSTSANRPVVRRAVRDIPALGASVRWLGQDGTKRHGTGDVHLKIDGITSSRAIVAAQLSDPTGATWIWRSPAGSRFLGDVEHEPLELAWGGDGLHAAFPPIRDETGSTMTLRVAYADGGEAFVAFPGGRADPTERSPRPVAGEVRARPGDDLQQLVDRGGTVRLDAGRYALRSPLILRRPIVLEGAPGAVLEFSQAANEPAWTAAIKLLAGNTRLSGFAVRFAGPVRWDREVGYGPAVIGTTDSKDPQGPPLFGIEIAGLDLGGVEATTEWEETINAVRLTNARCGKLEGNTIRGGAVEFWNGPWRIVGNTYTGTPVRTHMPGVFCGHYTRDLLVEKNTAEPVGPSGKSWRFLVLTQRGYRDVVRENRVVGLGAHQGDPHPHPNAPEVMLTEAYRIRFEGKPLGVSPDRRVLETPEPQAGPISSGDVVAILSGEHAGTWRLVAQSLGGGRMLLDRPLPAGVEREAVSVVTGFVEDRFEGNLVDSGDSRICFALVLAGNHFGTKVERNTLSGGGSSLVLIATGSETPGFWGWSHDPMFGLEIRGNRFVDAWNGGNLGVEHSAHAKSAVGRVYFEAKLIENSVVWSDAFAASRSSAGERERAAGLHINYARTFDPKELILEERGNTRSGAAWIPAFRVVGGAINGRVVVDASREFAPSQSAAARATLR